MRAIVACRANESNHRAPKALLRAIVPPKRATESNRARQASNRAFRASESIRARKESIRGPKGRGGSRTAPTESIRGPKEGKSEQSWPPKVGAVREPPLLRAFVAAKESK